MGISEHIYNHLALRGKSSDFSSKGDLEEFFMLMHCDDEQKWPLVPEDENTKMSYSTAKVYCDNFGFSQNLSTVVNYTTPQGEFLVAQGWECDDALKVDLRSIIRSGGGCGNFVYDFIRRHRTFLREFDKIQAQKGVKAQSSIGLTASSSNVGGVQTTGGYVWAVQGFDFASEKELELTRKAFKSFAASKDVVLEDKDLKLFTKPCHFAAFQCGVKVDGKNLGKAFLLQYTWYGKMLALQSNLEPEEYRYAKAYNENRGKGNHVQEAAAQLNKKYLKMMKKHYDNNLAKDTVKKGFLSRIASKFFNKR